MVAWFLRKEGLQDTHSFALKRVLVCLILVGVGAAMKSSSIFYAGKDLNHREALGQGVFFIVVDSFLLAVGGYYVLPMYFSPLIGFMLSDLFLYSGLLCLILLSLMRNRDRLLVTRQQHETDYQLLREIKKQDRTSHEVPLVYRI
jgi:hypothetical protein